MEVPQVEVQMVMAMEAVLAVPVLWISTAGRAAVKDKAMVAAKRLVLYRIFRTTQTLASWIPTSIPTAPAPRQGSSEALALPVTI